MVFFLNEQLPHVLAGVWHGYSNQLSALSQSFTQLLLDFCQESKPKTVSDFFKFI